ncbi:MAG: helix-turn-helix domain-containing protein [Rhizobiales bacterium]|nr:helix-turn-helix domain-containing protein [Hyphomicrobiales bacterium]
MSGERDNALEVAVGAEVRATRQALGVTLADLAKAAGISVGMLSKIENGQASPSLSTLQGLASALNVPIATFFARFDEKRDATYVKAGQGLAIERRGSSKGHLYQLLGHSLRSATQVEPFLITLDGRSDAYPIFQHKGVEFIYMLKGEVTYRHGTESYLLKPGDSLFFDAEALHGPLELRKLPAVYLSVIVTPAE